MVVNTPVRAVGARADGYEIRAAAVAMDRPSSPRSRSSAAAVQGIEALRPRRARTCARSRSWTDRVLRAATGGARGDRRTACRSRGEVLSTRRVGAYHHLTLVAPGIAEQTRPGPLRRARRRRPGHRRCCCAGRSRSTRSAAAASTAARSRSSSPCTAPARPGWPRSTRTTPVDVVGPLAGRSRCRSEPGQRDAGRRRLRQRAAVRAGRGAAQPAAAGSTSCSAPRSADRLFGVLDAKRMASTVAVTTDDGTRGQRGRVTDVLPAVIERARAPTSSTPADRWRCCSAVTDGRRRARRARAVRGRGVDGLRHRGLHDLRAAGRRRRRRDPDGALLRRRARCSAATGSAGTTSARCPPTRSARRCAGGH